MEKPMRVMVAGNGANMLLRTVHEILHSSPDEL